MQLPDQKLHLHQGDPREYDREELFACALLALRDDHDISSDSYIDPRDLALGDSKEHGDTARDGVVPMRHNGCNESSPLESRCWETAMICASSSMREFYMMASDSLLALREDEGSNDIGGAGCIRRLARVDRRFRFLLRCLRLCAERLSVYFTYSGLEVLKTYLQSKIRSINSGTAIVTVIEETLHHLSELLIMTRDSCASKSVNDLSAMRYGIVGIAWWLLEVLLSRSVGTAARGGDEGSASLSREMMEAAALAATRAAEDLLPCARIDAECVMLHAYRMREYITRLNAAAFAVSSSYRARCSSWETEYRISQSDSRIDVLSRGISELNQGFGLGEQSEKGAPWDEVSASTVVELRAVLEDAIDVQGEGLPTHRSIASLLGRNELGAPTMSISNTSSCALSSESSVPIWQGVTSHEHLAWSVEGCAAFALFLFTGRDAIPLVYTTDYLWALAYPNMFIVLKAYPGLYENASVQMDSIESRGDAGPDGAAMSPHVVSPSISATFLAASRWWNIGTRAFAAAFRKPSVYKFILGDSDTIRPSLLQFLDSHGLHNPKLWRCSAALRFPDCLTSASSPPLPSMLGRSSDALSFLQLITNVMVRCGDHELMKFCVFSLRYLLDRVLFPYRLLLIRRILLDCPYPQVTGAFVDYVKDRFQRCLQLLGQLNFIHTGEAHARFGSSVEQILLAPARDAILAAAKYQFNIPDAFSWKDNPRAQSREAPIDDARRKAIDLSSADCCVLAFYSEAMRICKEDSSLADAYCSVSVPIMTRFIVAPIFSHYLRSDFFTSRSTVHSLQSFQSGVDDLVAASALIFAISCNKAKLLRMFPDSEEELLCSQPRDGDKAVSGAEENSRLAGVYLPGDYTLSSSAWIRGALVALESLRSVVASHARSTGPRGSLGAELHHPSVDLFLYLSGRVLSDGSSA